jgi:hypothetical protein
MACLTLGSELMKSLQKSILRTQFKLGRILLLVVPTVLLIGLSALPAADFWEKKSYYEWTKQECTKMLTDSPWAWELKVYLTGNIGNNDAAGGQQHVSYIVQFLSALPIRQAVVRQMQIANKYDTLSDAQKQAFDRNTETFLNADYSDRIVVNVAYSTNVQSLSVPLAQVIQSKTTAFFANYTYLYANKGEKVKLLDFKPGQGAQNEFQFIFPRQVGGNPIATEQDKSLTLEFMYPSVAGVKSSEGVNEGKGYAEFKVKKMLFNGNLTY